MMTRIFFAALYFASHISLSQQEAQFFEAIAADKTFYADGASISRDGGGGGSSYGAPQQQRPSYNGGGGGGGLFNKGSSYGAPKAKPSYNAPSKPSYKGGKGKGINVKYKTIEIPVPDIDLNLPNPLEFKAGVLRSKGRIASGLLHAKAGLLRAGANILAQKAAALDKAAQAIPGIKAGIINALKSKFGDKNKGGGGYGAPPASSYGAPPASSYGAPPASSYGAPPASNYGAPAQKQQYKAPQTNTGYGAPQAAPIQSNYGSTSSSSLSAPSSSSFTNNGFNSGGYSSNQGQTLASTFINNNNNNNYGGGGIVTNNGFQASPLDSYSTSGGIITSSNINNNNNNNNFPVTSTIQVNSQSGFVSNSNTGSLTGNTFSNNFNQDSYGTPVGNPIGSTNSFSNNGNTFTTTNSGTNTFTSNGNTGPTTTNTFTTNTNNAGNNVNVVDAVNNVGNQFGVDTGLSSDTFGGAPRVTLNGNSLGVERLVLGESRLQRQSSCQSDIVLRNLLEDIFMGNEMIPDVVDRAPKYPLDLTYKTIRTYPGMKLQAESTRFKPMLQWPAEPDTLYTVVMSNLDINNRRNRTLSEFWHWFVANVPGDSVDDGDVIFDLLFPLVLPEGDGDHRFGYFVFKQPRRLNYKNEGGPTDSCSSDMSNGRGPFRSTKNFQKKYNLELTAATFLIIDYSEASMEIACEWQRCIGDTINLVSPLRCGSFN